MESLMATYGDSGDRWWVGQNTGGWTFAWRPDSNGYESLPSGDARDDAQFAAAASANAAGTIPGKPAVVVSGTQIPATISVDNIDWYDIQGPYTSQALANKAIPGIQKSAPAQGAVQQATGVNFSSIQNALTAFYDKVTDGQMWRSLGWLLLGILMIFVGLALLLRGQAEKAVSSVVKAVSIPLCLLRPFPSSFSASGPILPGSGSTTGTAPPNGPPTL
jgi:hypothetical protein